MGLTGVLSDMANKPFIIGHLLADRFGRSASDACVTLRRRRVGNMALPGK
jgi:hypothetical protein